MSNKIKYRKGQINKTSKADTTETVRENNLNINCPEKAGISPQLWKQLASFCKKVQNLGTKTSEA